MSLARMWVVLLAPLYLLSCQTPSGHHPLQDSAQAGTERLHPFTGNAWLEIDKAAFEGNLRTLRTRLGEKTRICVVMKADAYGHGMDLLIPSLSELGVPCVGITSNDEARRARARGFSGRLIRLRSATMDEVEDGLRYGLEEPVGNLAYARRVSDIGKKHARTIPMHLELDAGGMSRNGIELVTAQGKKEVLELLRLPSLKLVGIMTHFPVEEREDILRVLATFKEQADWVIENGNLDRSQLTLHCANSFATLEVPESHLDMVRVGAVLFGNSLAKYPEFKRMLQFKSRVASVNSYPAGSTVGYDRTFALKRDSRLANIPVGYSDGYSRVLSNRGHVLIRGLRHPIVGRVSMNTFMVDVTDSPAIQPGDEVVLFGKQGTSEITRAELEEGAGTLLADQYTIWGNSNPRILKAE
ncbi:alanine racemase [Cystobacter fuscus]|uniref:alanine racemase n=1 Tax=Cystobacter fuscus TaxID=43 RepID=UPI002B284434|nr:alanine racemase [Cystobacter fuscus]